VQPLVTILPDTVWYSTGGNKGMLIPRRNAGLLISRACCLIPYSIVEMWDAKQDCLPVEVIKVECFGSCVEDDGLVIGMC
jgi:hypothetical protein